MIAMMSMYCLGIRRRFSAILQPSDGHILLFVKERSNSMATRKIPRIREAR